MTKYYVYIPDPAASRLRKACAKVPCFSEKKSQNPKPDPTLKLVGTGTIGTFDNQKTYRDSPRCAAHTHTRKSPNGGIDFDLRSYEKIILDSKTSKTAVRQKLFWRAEKNLSFYIFFQV
jgi:hypothetical protein